MVILTYCFFYINIWEEIYFPSCSRYYCKGHADRFLTCLEISHTGCPGLNPSISMTRIGLDLFCHSFYTLGSLMEYRAISPMPIKGQGGSKAPYPIIAHIPRCSQNIFSELPLKPPYCEENYTIKSTRNIFVGNGLSKIMTGLFRFSLSYGFCLQPRQFE
jgi:hypothetical protein